MEKTDDLTFFAMYGVLQSGMWLLNDLEDYLRPLDMSQARLSILLAVKEKADGVISPREIALITGKSRPAITRTLEKLSGKGLLRIGEDPRDGRRKRLEITVKGDELLERIIPEYNERIRAFSEEFSDEEKRVLLTLLGKINFLDSEKTIRYSQ